MQTDAGDNQNDKAGLTSQEFVEKLKKALRRDGDFPASAKVVTELKTLVSNPGSTHPTVCWSLAAV